MIPEQHQQVISEFIRTYYERRKWALEQAFLIELPILVDQRLAESIMSQDLSQIARAAAGDIPHSGDGVLEEEIYEAIQGLCEDLCHIPGTSSEYHIPQEFWESPIGEIVSRAFTWCQGDVLITLADASKLRGVTVQAITNAVRDGRLRGYKNPDAPEKSGRTLVSRAAVEAWLAESEQPRARRTLDKLEVARAIVDGDRYDGAGYWLSVTPRGYRLHFVNLSRDERPWGDAPAIQLPALDPDGSGRLAELAQERILDLGMADAFANVVEEMSAPKFVAQHEPEDWLAAVENRLEWLLDGFLAACNGDGSELENEIVDSDAPWGRERTETGEDGDPIQPPARFEYGGAEPGLALSEKGSLTVNAEATR